MIRHPRHLRPVLAGGLLVAGLVSGSARADDGPAPSSAAGTPLPGRWLFAPSDIEAGLDPQLGWTLPEGHRFLLVALACAPDRRTLTLRLEVQPATSGVVSRTVETAAGAVTVTGLPEEENGESWIRADFSFADIAPRLAAPGPWRIADPPGNLADAGAGAAFAAFRTACGLAQP